LAGSLNHRPNPSRHCQLYSSFELVTEGLDLMIVALLLVYFVEAQYTGFFGHPDSGLCLAVSCAQVNCLGEITVCTVGNDLQTWSLAPQGGSGGYLMKSVGGGQTCIAPLSPTSGSPLEIYACGVLPKFKWTETDGPAESLILMNEADPTLCLSVEANAPGSAAILVTCDGTVSQQWVQGIPGGDIVPPDRPKGLSWGTIVLIAVFSFGLVYLGVGCIFQRKVKGVSSLRESFPNHELWMGLPKLVKDGALFTTRKIRDCFARCRGKPAADYETI
jgi:hypothetical protein